MSALDTDHVNEYAFIRESLRRAIRSKPAAGLNGVVRMQDLNWAEVERLLFVHGVEALVGSAVLLAPPDHAPAPFLDNMQRNCKRTRAYNVFLTKELDHVVQLLQDIQIPAIALKGPVLAQVAYPDIGSRACSDLDILIPADRFAQAREALCADGYRVTGRQSRKGGFMRRADMFFNQQASFSKGASVYNLDIHLSLMPPLFRYPIDFDEFWDRSVTVAAEHYQIPTFSPEDTLQLLCFHGLKNRWNRLKYIVDIGCLLQNQPLDWDIIEKRATEISARRVLGLGTYLSLELLGTTVPAHIKKRVYGDRATRAIGPAILSRFPAYTPKNETSYTERAFWNIRVQETLGNRLRYVTMSLLRRVVDRS